MTQSGAIVTTLSVLAAVATVAGAPPPETSSEASGLLAAAEASLEAGEYDQAVDLYDRLREALPESAEVPYNMGVAAFRAGDFERAAEMFGQALGLAADPSLRSRSAYNLGTTVATGVGQKQMAPDAQVTEQLDHAQQELQEALRAFRQALDLDPGDDDARANAELTYRLLKRLEELQQQMQQQQQQQQQQPSESDEQRDQQQSPSDTEPQNGEQQPPSSEAPASESRDPEDAPEQPSRGDQQQPDDAGELEEQDTQPESSSEETDRPPLSREEAERLLQSVRDKERQRRAEQERRERAQRPPVEKDW